MKTGEYNRQCTCQLCQPNWVFSADAAAMVPGPETARDEKPTGREPESLQRFLSALPVGVQAACN